MKLSCNDTFDGSFDEGMIDAEVYMLCTFVYVCMHVCIYVCMYAYFANSFNEDLVDAKVVMYVCMCVCIYMYMYYNGSFEEGMVDTKVCIFLNTYLLTLQIRILCYDFYYNANTHT